MKFFLGEEIDSLRASVRQFSKTQISPIACQIDRENKFPGELWQKMGALGLHGITVPETDGGVQMGYLAHCIAIEEISRASAAVGLSYGAHSNLCINQLQRWGDTEQKQKFLPNLISGKHIGALAMSEQNSGSDVVSMTLKAEKRNDGYVLNPSKIYQNRA